MPVPLLAVIDGHYYAYRFFHGMPRLTGPGGRPTGISYAFANLLRDLRNDPTITHWCCTFDTGDSFRHSLYPEYKAQRDPTPPEIVQQLPDLDRILAANQVPVLRANGFEADDVLFTLALDAAAAGFSVRLLTNDKDVDQVLSEQVRTWDPGKRLLRGPAELLAAKGIRPDQVVDWLCMVGDSADNVPGIKGVGEKTASKLLMEHGSLDALLAAVDSLKGKLQENVRAFIPKAAFTRELITLRRVPGLPPLESFAIDRNQTLDAGIYAELGFRSERFRSGPEGIVAPQATPVSAAATPDGPLPACYSILDEAGLPTVVERLRAAGRFALDTETTGLDPLRDSLVGISLACGDQEGRGAWYLPLKGVGATVPWDRARSLLAPLLTDPAVGKLGQNLKFDWRVLAAHGVEVRGYDGDCMLASWLLDPGRESHGLDHLAAVFLGESKIPTSAVVDLKAGQTMAQVEVERVARYACEDAQCTWRLARLLESRLQDQRLIEVYRNQEVPLALCLARMEQTGIACDRDILNRSQTHLQRYLEEVEKGIRHHTGPDFNPASPKQIAEWLFNRLKLPVISSTKTGPSTDASVLEALRPLHELPDLLLQWRTLSKLIGTYLARLPEFINPVDGRVHGSFRQTGTETGRLSSEQPNLQNIPKKRDLGREIRAAFTAPPDRMLIAADYSQIELRVLAHLSGDATLREAFTQGADIHRFVAAQVHGCDEASVTPVQRNAAKAVNFGIIYGQAAFGLAQQLGIPRGEAQRFIDGYFNRFASVKAYINRVVEEAAARGYAETMAGRRRHIPQLSSGNRNDRLAGERVALNTTIQGSAADLIKRAMIDLDRMLPPGARLILQIHDELLIEADAACAPQAAQVLTAAMIGAWKLDVPLLAEARTGRSWLEVS